MTGERIKKLTAKVTRQCISAVLAALVVGALVICASPVVAATELAETSVSGENSGEQQATGGETPTTDGEEQLTDGEEQFTDGEEQPTGGENQPTGGENQPTGEEGQPVEGEGQPTDTEKVSSTMTLAAAAEGEAPPAPEPSIPEDQVEVEAYAIPAGSAYIHEISKEYQYTNSANSNAINDALTGALTYLRDLYIEESAEEGKQTERVATIVVQDGTYQGGINMTQEGSSVIEQLILEILGLQSVSASPDASDMTIRIVSHDSVLEDDNGNIVDIHAGSEGNVKVEGAIDIDLQGLNLLLAGLYLSTWDTVTIENADSVEYYGTRQDDVVNLNISSVANHVTVDTGEGNDTVNADIKKKPNVEAGVTIDETLIQDFSNLTAIMLPGSGATGQEIAEALRPVVEDLYNTLVKGLDGSLSDISTVKVNIELGEGEDSANIKLIDSSDIIASLRGTPDPDTGLNMYQYGFAVDMTAAQMDISGGEGDDRISVSGGRSFTFGQNLMQALIDLVDSELANREKLPETNITVRGGLGDDVLTVDTTSAFSTWGGTSISTDGQDGFDRLHLTGKLNDKIDADERILVNAEGTELTIEALAQITILGDLTQNVLSLNFIERLKLMVNAIDALTDALLNKRTIYVDDIQPGDKALPFTNYIVNTEEADKTIQEKKDNGETEEKNVTYAKVDFSLADTGLVIPEGGVVLSNIILTDDLSQPISGRVGLDRLIAEGLNVLVMADIIDVSGDVSAKNLILHAYGEDAALAAIETQVVEDDLNGNSDLNIELGLYNADRKLQINVDRTARILAEQAVDMAVQMILNKAFLPGADYIDSLVGKDFNPVTLKFGQAEISIFGSIQAGGYIHARTDVDVTIDATNELIKAVVPVALAVSSGHSRVIVDGDAVLLSGYISEEAARENAGILLVANSSNDLVAYAYGGSVKFSIALGVVEFETVAQITGNANVDAGGAVKLLASSIVESTSYATGKPSIVWNVAPQSGVFIAGNFIFNETKAIIDGNANVTANQGDLVVDAFADSKASTVSMAIPFNTTPVGDQLTPFNVIPFVEKLIGIRPAGNQTIKGKLLAAVTGSNSLGNLFTDATKSAAPDTTFIQVMGALGMAYVKNDNLAKIETTGTVTTPGTLFVHATGTTVSDLRADGSLYRTPSILEGVLGNIFAGGPYATLETVPTHAIGAAIAVHVYIHNNEALIAKGTIQATDLSVVANSLDADAALVVKAGHTPTEAQTKLGIGGAIAVHVANVYNTARIQNTATYEIDGGDVEVIAKGHGTYITVADASGKRSRLNIAVGPLSIPLAPAFSMTANSAGVGAGIAVEVINLDTMAQIEDGVSFGSNKLNSLNVNASYDADFYIEAAAGSTGGTSIAPVVALTVSGVNTKATVGKLDGVVTEMPGAVSVTANTSAVREMIADAKAVGSRAGAGAAVGLSIVDDSAIAELFRSVKAGSVEVSADSISRIQQTIYASSQGATPNPVANTIATTEVTIKQFLALFTGQGLSGAVATNSMNPGSADNMTNKNAAALSGMAGRLGGYSGKTGTLSMDRIASLAEKRPKFQTTEGSVQVAATIAANIQRNKSQATIDDGLTIESQSDVQVTALEDTDAVIYADSTASNSTTGVGVAAAVNYVEYENTAYVGAKTIKANDLIVRADILEAENLRSVETILAELLNYLADIEGGRNILINTLLEAKNKEKITDLIDIDEFNAIINAYITELNADRAESEKLTAAEIETLKAEQTRIIETMVIDMLVASLQDDTVDTASALMGELIESIADEFFELLMDPQFLLSNVLGTGTAKTKFDQFIAENGMMASITFDMLREAVVTELTTKYGNPSELENMGNRITTSAVSGAGGTNVGIAGSLALSLIEGKAQAIIADLASSEDGAIETDGTLELYAQSANKVYTTASSSAANNGLPEKNKTGKADSTGKSVGVGASFAMAKMHAAAEALIGTDRVVNAAALSQQAIVHNDIDTVSVAGQDPIGRQQSFHDYVTPSVGQPYVPLNQTTSKDIAVDASAALNIIDNTVNAKVGEGSRLYLGGGNLVETARVIGENAEGEEIYELANLYLRARQRGQTYATASGFATGGTAAVGASVAINLANSDVNAVLSGEGDITGDVIVDAQTVNEDEAQGFALTYGTSLDRYFEKLRTLMSIANFLDNPDTGIVNALVVNKLNQYSASLLSPLQSNLAKSPLMTMALSALGIQVPIPSTSIGNSTASGTLAGTGAVAQEVSDSQETSVNIAAAVGVNVTAHKANATINGDFTGNSFDADAQALANYRAYATGATMLANPLPNINASAISMGVAVSVNENAANASLGGNLTARNGGNVRAHSTITQNQDDKYSGLLAAQSLAGAVGGSGSGVGLAGAVSVVKTKAESSAQILDGANIIGGDIVVNALDKSKIAIRAGGLMAGGQTVGLGAAFGMIYDQNNILARVGSNAAITGSSLDVVADRQVVTADDYEFPFDLTNLFTVSNGSQDDISPDQKGLIHLNITDGSDPDDTKGDNSIEVNLSTERVLSVIDMLNYMASVNYYIEAISGAIAADLDSKAALTGGFAVLYAESSTSAEIGDNTTVDLTGGIVNVEAKTDTLTRVIGGSLAATGAAGVGVNAAGFYDQSTVNASIGNGSTVTASGDADIRSNAKNDVTAVTVAAALSTGTTGGAAAGGTIDVIVTDNNVNASVGEDSTLESTEGNVTIEAENDSDFILVSASASGAGQGPAAGGTFAVIISGNETSASAGNGAAITAAKNATIRAASEENLINVLASASAAAGSASAAGTIGVLVTESNTLTSVGSDASVTAKTGSVQILSDNDVKQIAVQASLTGSTGSAAVGAAVNVGVFEQTATVNIGDNTKLTANGGNVTIFATGKNQTILVNAAGAAASGTSLTGVIPVVISKSTVGTHLGNYVTVEAWDTIAIAADLNAGLHNAAGSITASAGSAGIGATISTAVVQNSILSTVGTNARLIAHAVQNVANSGGVKLPNRSAKRRGVIVSANANVQILMASVSGAVSNTGASGVVNTLVLKNVVKATVGDNGMIEAGFASEDSDTESGDDAEAAIESSDESQIFNLAGSVGVGANAGVGATVVSMVYDKNMEASVGTGGTTRTTGNVNVTADSADELYLLALSFAGGGSAAVGVGANALVFENDVASKLGGTVTAGGDVTVTADSETDIFNLAAALAGSGTAAVTPVAVVTWFEGTTDAQLLEGASIQADGDVSVNADSREFITADAAGVSVSGTASVSGTVDIIISDQTTSAQAQKNVSIDAANIAIAALDNVQVLGVVGTVAASGTAAVGVTAMVSVLHNTVTSGFLGGENAEKNTVKASGDVNVTADAIRDIRSYAASVAASGGAGVGATIMVNVVGGKLSQDASDSLLMNSNRLSQEEYDKLSDEEKETYDKETKGGFDADGFLDITYGSTYTKDYRMDTLGEKLQGDGVKQSDIQLGDDNGGFDAESGYVSDDFHNEDYVDVDETGKEAESARGEDYEIDESENEDITEAGSLSAPKYNTQSAVSAVIGSGVQVTAGGDINVLSGDLVNSDMIAATAGVGAYAGVGAGIAVNVLYSNVIAGVDDNAVLNAGGDIVIKATSGTETVEEGSDQEEANRNDQISNLVKEESFKTNSNGNYTDEKTSSNKLDISSRTIRSIAVTGAGGIAGVSVSGSVIILNNKTIAYLAGDVTGANNLTVCAESKYPQILAVTGTASGGIAAVGASSAVVYHEGEVEASIQGDAQISGVENAITVNTVTETDTIAAAAAVAGGAVSVNAGVAAAVNRMQVDTYIGSGVSITGDALKKLDVNNHSSTGADAWLMSVAGGGVAAGISGAVTIVAPTVYTYIGVQPDAQDAAASSGSISTKNAAVTVKNTASSTAKPLIVSVGAGGVAVTGSVLLSFNHTNAAAGILRKNIVASSIDVDAYMDAQAEAVYGSATVGSVAVGFSVAYVHQRAANRALLDVTGVSIKAGSVGIYAGRSNNFNDASAKATSVSANVGAVAVSINAAIADNQSSNIARIIGAPSNTENLNVTGPVHVQANGNATAISEVTGLNLGSVSVAASAAAAVLRSTQEAVVEGGNIHAGSMSAKSTLNPNTTDTAQAKLLTGSGGLISAQANVAVAYGRSKSIAGIGADTLTATGDALEVLSTGNAGTTAKINNQSFGYITAGVMSGYAYSQGVFHAYLLLGSGSTVTADSVSVEVTGVNTRATADVTPSAAGVDASYMDIDVNLAIASAKAAMRARIDGINNAGGIIRADAVSVEAQSDSYTDAYIRTPVFKVNAAEVAANTVISLLDSVQEASVGDVTIETSGNITVQSRLNTHRDTTAKAELGNTGKPSGSVSLVSAKTNVAVAKANGRSTAKISKATVTGADEIEVSSTGRTVAKAYVPTENASVNLAGIGINVLYANSDGGFDAIVDTAGASLQANSMNILSDYTAHAEAAGKAPSGGVGLDISLVNVKTNVANAKAGSTSAAGLSGAGTVILSGDLTVNANGIVDAVASFPGTNVTVSAVNVAVNVVDATVSAKQEAYVKDASVAGKNMTVSSFFNQEGQTAANASVGSNTGANVSLIGSDVSTADANSNATVKAYLDGASTDLKSALLVQVKANAKADADIIVGDTISLVNASVLETTADTAGNFEAGIDTTNGTVKAASISVKNDYNAEANAISGAAGAVASVVSATYNDAKSTTSITATAKLTGSGIVKAGELLVQTTAQNLLAVAEGMTAKTSLTVVKLALNRAIAKNEAVQEAYIDNSGSIHVDGDVNVKSIVESARAEATVGAPAGAEKNGGFAFSFVSGNTNIAESNSKISNKAAIRGTADAQLNAEDVTVLAQVKRSDSKANTKASNAGLNVSFFTAGNLQARAYTEETIEATITGTTVNATGNVNIHAKGNTFATANGEAPGSLSLFETTTSEVEAYVGHAVMNNNKVEYRRQHVKAYIGDNASVTADSDGNYAGNVDVFAENLGYAEAIMNKKTSVNLGNIDRSSIPTQSYYQTEASTGSGAVVKGENISIVTKDVMGAKSHISSKNVSLGFHADYMMGKNAIDAINCINIWGSSLIAANDLTVQTSSKANMSAETLSDSKGGFINGSALTARNDLNRDVYIRILDGSKLEADFGDILIEANAGENDNIYTKSDANNVGFTSIGDARVYVTAKTNVYVDIYRGAELKNTFGRITVEAKGAMDNMYAYSRVYNAGVGNEPDAQTFQTLNLITNVKIGESYLDAESGLTVISGRNVDIRSVLGALYAFSYAYARGRGLGVNVDTTAEVYSALVNHVDVDNAKINGYDSLTIVADNHPSSYGDNLKAEGYSFAQGIGRAEARARLYPSGESIDGNAASAAVNLGANVDLIGTGIVLKTERYDGYNTAYAHTKRTGIASAGDYRTNNFKSSAAVNVDPGAVFHVGDAAAGIVIDISDRANVRAVGIPNEAIGKYITAGNDAIVIQPLSNSLAGTLQIQGKLNGNTIYNQSRLGELLITNRTNKDIQFGGVSLENRNFIAPQIKANNTDYIIKNSDYTNPPIRVTNYQDGDLTVNGLVAGQDSLVTFEWIGQKAGSLYSVDLQVSGTMQYAHPGTPIEGAVTVAPVFAKTLVVSGAQDIGTADDRFHAYLFGGKVAMYARDSIYTMLTPVTMYMVNELPTSCDKEAPALDLGKIEAVNLTDVVVGEGLCLYRLSNTDVISVPVPGTLTFLTTDEITLSETATLNTEALERYLSSYDYLTDTYTYLLPNGTTIITDASGKVIAVMEEINDSETVTITLSDYSYDGTTVKLAEGVSLNLTDGSIIIEEGYTYSALLSTISGMWLVEQLNSGAIKVVYEDENALGQITEEDQDVPSVLVSGLVEGPAIDGKIYYWLKGYAPEDVDFSGKSTLYYLVLDTESDTLEFRSFRYQSGSAEAKDTVSEGTVSKASQINLNALNLTMKVSGLNDLTDASALFEQSGVTYLGSKDGKHTYLYNSIVFQLKMTTSMRSESVGDNGQAMLYTYKAEFHYSDLTSGNICNADISEMITGQDAEGNDVRNVVLGITASANEVRDENGNVVGTTANSATLSVTGTEGNKLTLKLKAAGVPNQTAQGYRVTDQLYVTKDGEVVIIRESYTAICDIMNKGFASNFISIHGTDNINSTGFSVSLNKGQKIYREKLTENVAVDVSGNYYYKLDGSNVWQKATNTSGTIAGGGYTFLKITEENGVTYYEICYGANAGLKAGSDGSVGSADTSAETATQVIFRGENANAVMGELVGKTVKLTLEGEGSTLDSGDAEAVDITADQAEIVSNKGTIGTSGNPITIKPYTEGVAAELIFSTATTSMELTSDAVISVEGDGDISNELAEEMTIDGGSLSYTATGDVSFGKFLLTNGAELEIDAGGNVTGEEIRAFIDRFGDTLAAIKAEGDISIDYFSLDDNETTLQGNGNLTIDKAALKDGTFNANVTKDIYFAIIEARNNDLTLDSEEGNINTTIEDGYIRFKTDTGKELKLSAGSALLDQMKTEDPVGNIGTAEREIIVDTDAILQIPAVNNYYIDSVELVGEELFAGKRPVVNIGSGIDENGEYQEGDYISEAGPDETVYVALKTQLGEDIAEVLTDRMEREAWTAMIDEAVMLALIKAETISAEQMEDLLGQTGNPMVLKDIEAMLKQGDGIVQGESISGYEKLAQTLLAELDSKNANGEAVFSNDLLEAWLAEGIAQSQVNIDKLAEALADTMTAEEVEQLILEAYAKADYESQKTTMPEDPEPRGVEIQVGQATGGAYVENEGDITITQQKGTLTAGAVISDRGDVTLTAEDGGIEGTAGEEVNVLGKTIILNAKQGVGAETPVSIEQRDNRLTLVANVIKPVKDGAGGYADVNVDALDQNGVPTTEAESTDRPEALFALETLVHFDWLRVEYPMDAMQLNVNAGGDVNIVEVTGDMGIGVVETDNGDITLSTDGDVLDTRGTDETKENIITGSGDVMIRAEDGQAGTTDKPIETNVGGTVTALTEGDVNITDTGTLDLIVQIEDGQVNASAEEDIAISNLSGDLTVGPIQAGGDADITAEGSIIAGDRLGKEAQVEAENISLTAKDGHIGTPEEAFLVDTDGEKNGKLSGDGEYLNIRELDGDLILDEIISDTDAELSAPGSILDGNDSTVTEATQAQKDANKAQAEADEADAKAQVQEEEAARTQQALEAAEKALEEAIANTEAGIQSQIDKAKEELQNLTPGTDAYEEKLQQVEDLEDQLEEAKRDSEARNKALEEAKKQYQEALDEHTAQQKEADEARADADATAAEAERLQDLADAAAEAAKTEGSAVTTGGDLTLDAGDSIGTEDTGLTVDVDGTVHAAAEETVNLDGHGDLDLGDITAKEEIRVSTVDGDITGGVLESEKVDVSALGGDIGAKDDPLTTNAEQIDAQGDNVYIHNLQDTTVGSITAEDELVLDSDGDVTGTGDGPNVSADDATINADGDIGSDDKPLDTNVDAFHGNAEDIHIDNHSPNMEISDVNADSLDVQTDGSVTGENNTLHDITIDADGYVGRPDDPFEFWADGSVSIRYGLGSWWRNLYQPNIGRMTALLVLRFEITVAGRNMTVYALIGVTQDGKLQLIGFFLCEGMADETFWISVFACLKERMNIRVIDKIIHDEDRALEAPARRIFGETEIVDLAEYSEGELNRQLGQLSSNPAALAEELDIFRAEIETQLEASFETEKEVYAALLDFANQFTQACENWIDFAG